MTRKLKKPQIGNNIRRLRFEAGEMTQADLAALLKPELLRNLARDARYRLTETVAGREQAGMENGTLADLLANYPDPDANETPSIPQAIFVEIAAQLATLPQPVASNSPWSCDLACQQKALLDNVTTGEKNIDAQLATLDIGKLTEGEGLNILGLLIKRKYFADNHVPYAR